MAHSRGMGPGALQPGGLDPCSEVSGTAVFHCLISKKITFLLTVKVLSPTLKENTTTAASTRARRSHSYRRRAVLGSRPTLSRPHGVTVCSEPHSLAHTKWVPLPCHAHGHPLPGPICPCCAQCPTLRCWTSREPHSAAGFQEIFSPICFLFLFSTLPRLSYQPCAPWRQKAEHCLQPQQMAHTCTQQPIGSGRCTQTDAGSAQINAHWAGPAATDLQPG